MKEEIYRQGSLACQNYSRLTLRARLASQYVLVVYGALVVGAYAILHDTPDAETLSRPFSVILFGSACAMLLVATALLLVSWHYQTAFEAIRDSLAQMERDAQHPNGPWHAHQEVRRWQYDWLASYGPAFILFLIALIAMAIGGVGLELWNWSYVTVVVACGFLIALLGAAGLVARSG